MSNSAHLRELGAFLKLRRAELSPAQVGLPEYGHCDSTPTKRPSSRALSARHRGPGAVRFSGAALDLWRIPTSCA